MKKYRTILGDTWDLIAYKMYGNEYKMNAIIEANQEHIDTVIFKSGIMLNIPEHAEEDEYRAGWLGDEEDI